MNDFFEVIKGRCKDPQLLEQGFCNTEVFAKSRGAKHDDVFVDDVKFSGCSEFLNKEVPITYYFKNRRC
jgi:hypothetical protein